MEVSVFQIQIRQFIQDFILSLVAVWFLSLICRAKAGTGNRWWPKSRGVDVAAMGLLAVVLASGISWLRAPLPAIHDEFSYLVAADTFSHGRFANPTHPMWRHFETMHVIQQPTYASKYPPGQGMILALGKILADNPDVGLWLSSGLAAAAAVWMLRGWMPRRWALLGGFFTALHPGIQLVWTQSYWGGNVAFIGGALVLGAYARLRRMPCCRDAVWMSAGLAILANSRPLEGAVASLPVALAMFAWPIREWVAKGRGSGNRLTMPRQWLIRIAVPLAGGLGVTALFMGYYNWRVTGDPWRMPYAVHEQTYGATPVFLWQPAGPMPEYRHAEIRELHGWLRATHLSQQSQAGFFTEKTTAFVHLWQFYLGIALSIPFLALPWILRQRRYWLPTAVVVAVGSVLLMTTWANPHYAAPAGPALLLLAVQGIRHLRIRTRRRTTRRSLLIRALVLTQLFGFLPAVCGHVLQGPNAFAARRAEMVRHLQTSPERHLIIVRYWPEHNIHQEWVYNEANIEAAKIVWARSMHSRADRQLAAHFADRRIWLLSADEEPPQLVPYRVPPRPMKLAGSEDATDGYADRP